MEPHPPEAALAAWRTWIGHEEIRHDRITSAPLVGLAAMLDRDEPEPRPGDAIPPLAHWLYTLPRAPQSQIGDDGHPRRGGFLPPVLLPRRMWAGGRFVFEQPLCVGDDIERRSRIVAVNAKVGRSGPLVFVTVRHELHGRQGLALSEEHDIVYRDAPQAGATAPAVQPAPADAAFRRRVMPDPVLLFRYSALTFNGHRIHYDRRWCEQAEGYPGLVVHGPLMATLLLDLLRRERPGRVLRSFGFTALQPVFDTRPFELCGREDAAGHVALWVAVDGHLAMRAQAQLR